MTFDERIKAGKLYFCTDEGFASEQLLRMELLYDFNQSRPSEVEKRRKFYLNFFASVGSNLYLEPPFHASWGKNTHWGNNCYANFNLTLVDDGEIFIGDSVMFAPNVVLSTTGHPINPDLRRKVAQFSIPIVIGNNVWVGANAVILPGVHIGDNAVIGAGSIVTKNIPANVIAVGNPCRVLREISAHDDRYYYKNMEIDVE